MFVVAAPGRQGLDSSEGIDPALLAFVKWHVTSTIAWDALRYLAENQDRRMEAGVVARALCKPHADVVRVLQDLARQNVVEETLVGESPTAGYRLPAGEPSTLVLRRLIAQSTRSQELRQLIAAHLQRLSRPRVMAAGEPVR